MSKDYVGFDEASQLGRPGVFRLNIGDGRERFSSLFGPPPGAGNYDFAALDTLMPHPLYAAQSFVCVLNPSAATFEACKALLAEAYDLVATRHGGRARSH